MRLDVLVADELVPAFARIVSRRRVQEEGERMVEKLHQILPKQLMVTKIQAHAPERGPAKELLERPFGMPGPLEFLPGHDDRRVPAVHGDDLWTGALGLADQGAQPVLRLLQLPALHVQPSCLRTL